MVLFEDEHLLVVNKPAGWNTHAPSLYAGEGLYDWLRHRERRWAELAIIHRLDKETSGIIVFSKGGIANQSLTRQFAERQVQKTYVLASDRASSRGEWTVRSRLARSGDRYVSRAGHGESAETGFRRSQPRNSDLYWYEATPLTGRTHQIRVHAAESGIPIFGDTLYGGAPAGRVFLHAARIQLKHPETSASLSFEAPPNFASEARTELRRAIIDPGETTAFRLVHGASDGRPGWYVDRLGDFLLSHSEAPLDHTHQQELVHLAGQCGARGAYHKNLSRRLEGTCAQDASPRHVWGAVAPDAFDISENGLRFQLSLSEGYSVGLFLDQRDNRRRLLNGYVGPDFDLPLNDGKTVLNAFAYTCGFSVFAARAGARVTSLDLSRKYLDWGARNFELNGLTPSDHDFIYGDAFAWFKRLARKGRQFDLLILDPPTFSRSRESGLFRAEHDFGRLVAAAIPLLKRPGALLASCNTAAWEPADFVAQVARGVRAAGRRVARQHFFPQPPDFPVSRAEPGYLKTLWMMVG